MLKPLTLSVSLAIALGASSVSMAGLFHKDAGCDTCGLASPQGVVAPTAQSVIASPQSYDAGCGDVCDTGCAPKKKHGFLSHLHKPKVYTYEWVLKKKKVKHHKADSCDTCGSYAAPSVYPTAQSYASPQGGYVSPQGYGSPQGTYGAPQSALSAPGEMRPAAPAGEVPPPPEATPATSSAATGSPLFLSPAGN